MAQNCSERVCPQSSVTSEVVFLPHLLLFFQASSPSSYPPPIQLPPPRPSKTLTTPFKKKGEVAMPLSVLSSAATIRHGAVHILPSCCPSAFADPSCLNHKP